MPLQPRKRHQNQTLRQNVLIVGWLYDWDRKDLTTDNTEEIRECGYRDPDRTRYRNRIESIQGYLTRRLEYEYDNDHE